MLRARTRLTRGLDYQGLRCEDALRTLGWTEDSDDADQKRTLLTRARRWTLRTVTPFSECVWCIGGHKRISVDEPKDETLAGGTAVDL